MFHSQCQLCFHYHHQKCYLISYPQRSSLRRFLHFHTESGFSNENQSKRRYFTLLILFLILRYRGEIQSTPYSCLIKNYSRTKVSGKFRKRTLAGGKGIIGKAGSRHMLSENLLSLCPIEEIWRLFPYIGAPGSPMIDFLPIVDRFPSLLPYTYTNVLRVYRLYLWSISLKA